MSLLDRALQQRTVLKDQDVLAAPKTFLFLIFLLDCLYLFGAIYQHFLVGEYPDRKWTARGPTRKFMVFAHIIFGSLAIYCGAVFYICIRLEFPINVSSFGYVIAVSQILHGLTNAYMNNFVYGDRRLCR